MPPSVQGLRGTARGLRSHGHPRHDPLDAPPPRAPKPKAPASALTFKTGSQGAVFRQGAPPFGKKNEPCRVLLLDASRLFHARIQSVVVVNEAIVVCWYPVF